MREKFQRIFNRYKTPDISLQLNSLVLHRERIKEGLLITKFYGGPLDLKHFGIENAWLSPFEIKSRPGRYSLLNVDVIQINDDRFSESILVDLTPDDVYRLGLKDPKELFNYGLIIRINPNQLYFPVFPDRRGYFNLEQFKRVFFGFLNYLGIEQYSTDEEIRNYLQWYNLGDISKLENVGGFYIRKRRLGNFSVWDVVDGNFSASFPFFQIFQNGEILFEDCMEIRIDSDCQIGQIYDDGGCDCRSQFLKALNEGATLFHFPLQDGRGWGMLSKMKTEELKRKMNTIKAAQSFFGNNPYDIRDYGVVGDFLNQLEIRQVVLQTDNRLKVDALKKNGIEVLRKPTETLNY